MNSTTQVMKQDCILWPAAFLEYMIEEHIPYPFSLKAKFGFISMNTVISK